MTAQSLQSSNVSSRLIDFTVLLVSFLIFAMLLGVSETSSIAADLTLYVCVVFVSVRACKRIIFGFAHLHTRTLQVLLGNIAGLLLGSIAVLFIGELVPIVEEMALVVVFSSITAFFVLGTLSPLCKASHRDIINH